MITVKLPTYDLSASQRIIVEKLLEEQPGLTIEEYSAILNISQRTFFRYKEMYNLKMPEKVKTRHPYKQREASVSIRYIPRSPTSVHLRIKSIVGGIYENNNQ